MLSLGRLREVFGPGLERYAIAPIKQSPRSRVVRLRLSADRGYAGPDSAIVKILSSVWPDDPQGPDRERRLYETLLPHVGIRVPELYGVTVDRKSGARLLFLEDLGPDYRFLAPKDVWTPVEIEVLLKTYARLHVGAQQLLPPIDGRGWLMQPWHVGLEAPVLIQQVQSLVERGTWKPLPGYRALIERTVDEVSSFTTQHVTLLHNDLYPPNVALPREPGGAAALIDWEMASWGLPEMDLAYLFLQPFRSAGSVDRAWALDYYWGVRGSWEKDVPDPLVRRIRQDHADRVMALALVRVAYRVVESPFPHGSDQAAYWASMFDVLESRLRCLSDGLRGTVGMIGRQPDHGSAGA